MSLIGRLGQVAIGLSYVVAGHYMPWPAFQNEWLFALGAAFLAAEVLVRSPKGEPCWPWPAVGVAGLAVLPWLQWGVSQILFFSDALMSSAYLAALALSMVVGYLCRKLPSNEDALAGVFDAFIGAGCVSVAVQCFQWAELSSLWVSELRPGARAYGNLGQANHLATLLGLGWVGVWLRVESGRLSGRSAGMLAAWLGLGIVMTQSRTAGLSAALLICLGLMAWRRQVSQLSWMVWPGAAVLLAVAMLGWPLLNGWLLIAQESPWSERMELGVRKSIWPSMVSITRLSPWVGWGWNQVVVAQHAAAAFFPVGHRMVEYSHNLFLDLALWVGVPVGGGVALAMIGWATRSVSGARTVRQHALLAATGVIFVHMMTEYPHAYLYFLIPCGFFIGGIEADRLSGPVRRGWWVAALMGAGLLVLLFKVGVGYFPVEESERTVRMALAWTGAPPDQRHPSSDDGLFDSVLAYQQFRFTQARPGMTEPELATMKRVVSRHPFPPALLRYALALGLNGRPQEAAAELRALCNMHPAVRCDEAKVSWQSARERYPQLGSFPPEL